MFKPAKMEFIRVLALERCEAIVLQELGNLGLVQLTRSNVDADNLLLKPSDFGADLGRCSQLQARVRTLEQSLKIESRAGLFQHTPIDLHEAERRLSQLESTFNSLRRRQEETRNRCNETRQAFDEMAVFRDAPIPFEWRVNSSFLCYAIGSIWDDKLSDLQQQLSGKAGLAIFSKHDDLRGVAVLYTKGQRQAVSEALDTARFREQPVRSWQGRTLGECVAYQEEENRKAKAAARKAELELETFTRQAVEALGDIACSIRLSTDLLHARESSFRSESLVLFTGWGRADDMPLIRRRLLEGTSDQCIVEGGMPDSVTEEEIPVLLQHGRFLRPFDMLVSAYGLPLYNEFEPTLLVAVSYVLMFGMMFGDVGHGALLVIGGLLLRLFVRSQKMRDAGTLMLFAGGSSMLFGLGYGSCFGLPDFKKHALWHDPLQGNPLHGMYAAVAFGIALITGGTISNVVNRLRHRDMSGAILDKFGALSGLQYLGCIGLAIASARALPTVRHLLSFMLGLSLVCWILARPLQLMFAKGWSFRRFIPAFLEGLTVPFEALLSYFANTVSFVRLAAYAMSHAAILAAAFSAAEAFRNSPVLAFTSIVLGNGLAILLEGIVASVQALRLEYYEFFGKFFSGAGQPFKPFTLTVPSIPDNYLTRIPSAKLVIA